MYVFFTTLFLTLGLGFGMSEDSFAASVTLLHTNDLHSHFRPDRGTLGLGGVARIKTAVARIRKENPATLFVDGGDWSEGNIYYNEGAGAETLRMMDHLSYDVAVVGNHDWLNGPDTLLAAIDAAKPSLSLIAGNVSADEWARRDEFKKWIPPYVIKNTGGARIAFIGLVTYEFIYDRFFSPIRVLSPFSLTQELAARLKSEVDAVVVVSHNTLKLNEQILRDAPAVDLIIGAHDHVKLTQPRVVKRPGHPDAWIVEAGCWGQWLGRMDLNIEPESSGRSSVTLKNYGLIQMDSRIPENKETLARLRTLEAKLETRYGAIFHDHVAHSEIEIDRLGAESRMGNFATDAYRAATGVDFSIDQIGFIYGGLHQGDWRTVDLYNANPGVHDPETGKSWTLKTFGMTGQTLKWLLNLLYSNQQWAQLGVISTSGLNVTWSSSTLAENFWMDPQPWTSLFFNTSHSPSMIHEILVGGEALDPLKTYRVAGGGGILQSVDFINSVLPGAVPVTDRSDTGIEAWRSMMTWAKALSPVTPAKVPMGNRLRSREPDAGIYHDDLTWVPLRKTRKGTEALIRATITNFGASTLPAGMVSAAASVNRNGTDLSRDADPLEIGTPLALSALDPMQSQTVEWKTTLPPLTATSGPLHGVTVRIVESSGVKSEVNTSNNSVTRWFQ